MTAPGQPSDGAGTGADPDLAACEVCVGHAFADRTLLRTALTHASAADNRLQSYERLEFLGDAVLDLVVCERLYRSQPQFSEGPLTEIRSAAVSRSALAAAAERGGLDAWIRCGRGVMLRGGPSEGVRADVYEALVAALYLDGGLDVAAQFVDATLGASLAALAAAGCDGENHKSILQEREQQAGRPPPEYRVVEESGPDHAKVFQVSVCVDGTIVGWGEGGSKKEAEQAAAREALRGLALREAAERSGGSA